MSRAVATVPRWRKARAVTLSGDSRPRVSNVLRSLFVEPVVAHEFYGPCSEDVLLPEEARCVADAVPRRRREFAAGRLCARASLLALGLGETPLLVGEDQFPRWPRSAIGSITHSHDFCGVVVARRTHVEAIGIDAELDERLEPSLLSDICTRDELRWLEDLPDPRQRRMATVIFSAKEAFYKCQYGRTRTWLGFHDVNVRLEDDHPGDGGGFQVFPIQPIVGFGTGPFSGHFRVHAGLVVTGVAVRARG